MSNIPGKFIAFKTLHDQLGSPLGTKIAAYTPTADAPKIHLLTISLESDSDSIVVLYDSVGIHCKIQENFSEVEHPVSVCFGVDSQDIYLAWRHRIESFNSRTGGWTSHTGFHSYPYLGFEDPETEEYDCEAMFIDQILQVFPDRLLRDFCTYNTMNDTSHSGSESLNLLLHTKIHGFACV